MVEWFAGNQTFLNVGKTCFIILGLRGQAIFALNVKINRMCIKGNQQQKFLGVITMRI